MSKKDSFLMYKSFYGPIQMLATENKGLLLEAIFEYQISGKQIDMPADVLMAFQFFKNQFRIDDEKYEKVIENNRVNGYKGGRPKTEKSGRFNKKRSVIEKAKKGDNDNVNENDNDNVNDNDCKDTSSEQQVAAEPNGEEDLGDFQINQPKKPKENIKKSQPPAPEQKPEQKNIPEEFENLVLYREDEKLIKLWPVLKTAWAEAFPGIDILAEVKAAHAWEVANPKKRKVDRARFLQNWMGRSQDKYGGKIVGGRGNSSDKGTEYNFGGK